MLKAIFWDNDGVLVSTEHLYFESNRATLAKYGFNLSLEQFKEISLRQGKSVFELPGFTPPPEEAQKRIRDERNALFSLMLEKSQDKLLKCGVKDALERLSPTYAMGIVTSCRKEHFEIIHRETQILHYFRFIISEGDYPHSKPHPAPYLTALEKSGFEADECVVVEDSERGLAAAAAAGIKCFVIPDALTADGDFGRAFKVLENVSQLEGELAKL
ncbi:MAG: hypothetical protein A2020_12900 [Lentisphaerae bacterium GWF2_45_14]|nr:MAG: hypothetical protein A2020_12900 [Lentisphaerae bacterium GWF2_45_14]